MQAGQEQVEPRGVLEREPLGERVLPRVEVVELALQTDDLARAPAARFGLGPLGVQPLRPPRG